MAPYDLTACAIIRCQMFGLVAKSICSFLSKPTLTENDGRSEVSFLILRSEASVRNTSEMPQRKRCQGVALVAAGFLLSIPLSESCSCMEDGDCGHFELKPNFII